MADVVSIGHQVASVDVSPQFLPYSKVIIHVDDDTAFVEGNDTGRVFEIDNPFGSQEMARNILAKLSGYRYQPFVASEAILDPAAEIGDVVNTATSYGGLYTRNRTFGRLMRADVSAPNDEDIDHEFRFVSPQERKFTRVTGELRASLILTNNMIESEVVNRENADSEMSSRITQNADGITAEVNRATQEEGRLQSSLSVQASEIAAKVSASGGSNTSGSFSWALTASGHKWFANGSSNPVMEITASGLTVRGRIESTTGKIGGFDIGSSALSYNGLTWGDTSKNYGAYIGQSGIQLGKNFRVDNGGNVSATNMNLSGTLTVGGSAITAEALRSGAQSAYTNGSYWSGGAGYGFSFANAIDSNSGAYPGYFRATVLSCSTLAASNITSLSKMVFRGYNCYVTTVNGVKVMGLGG